MLPLNVQEISQGEYCSLGTLSVVDVWETIQGEGPFAGYPAIFIRLAGCNMRCPKCDTDYTSNAKMYTPDQLHQKIDGFKPTKIVLTGGEPFRQNISIFATQALQYGYDVHVETNGTIFPEECRILPLYIVCSPKLPNIVDEMQRYVRALKYVLKAGEIAEDGLPDRVLGYGHSPARPWYGFRGEVIVQPMDEGDPKLNKWNEQAALESAMKFGYRFQIQLHKHVGLK